MVVEFSVKPFLPEEIAVESPEDKDGNEGNEACPSDWSRLLGEQSECGGDKEDAPLFEAEGVVGEAVDGLLDEFEVFVFVVHGLFLDSALGGWGYCFLFLLSSGLGF